MEARYGCISGMRDSLTFAMDVAKWTIHGSPRARCSCGALMQTKPQASLHTSSARSPLKDISNLPASLQNSIPAQHSKSIIRPKSLTQSSPYSPKTRTIHSNPIVTTLGMAKSDQINQFIPFRLSYETLVFIKKSFFLSLPNSAFNLFPMVQRSHKMSRDLEEITKKVYHYAHKVFARQETSQNNKIPHHHTSDRYRYSQCSSTQCHRMRLKR